LSHFEPLKFNIAIALAMHVYDNAVAFWPRDFAANEISIHYLSPNWTYAPGGLTLGSALYF